MSGTAMSSKLSSTQQMLLETAVPYETGRCDGNASAMLLIYAAHASNVLLPLLVQWMRKLLGG